MTEHAEPRPPNRLIHSTSPYLLQHAHNPVDWYPWGEEALSRARAEDKPILLSIGYSACHWCHVMAHESFEDEAELRTALAQLAWDFDPRFGGLGGAPKFPPSASLSLLLRCHRRFGDERALEMARKTLDEMARGGMYDQVGGGFHRYSVDAHWLVPHFEKMLYDNGQLASLYLHGWLAFGDPECPPIRRGTLDLRPRQMDRSAGRGVFYYTRQQR